MYIISNYLPIITGIVTGIMGRKMGEKGVERMTVGMLIITWVITMMMKYEVGMRSTVTRVQVGEWIVGGKIKVWWEWIYDVEGVTMMVLVVTIGTIVQIYTMEYMRGDPHKIRMMTMITIFIWFMMQIITGGNMIIVLIGWEGVGVCSYMLINHWYTRIEANKAAIKAIVMNRVGDIGIIIGIAEMYRIMNSSEIEIINGIGPYIPEESKKWIGIAMMIGVMGKSAQIGLHTWLPDAMEGPTPVSALIHAATMVTAGVFILYRIKGIMTTEVISIVGIIGGMTALYAGTVGWVQNDIKRVIAYSTCSQLGYMVMSYGSGMKMVSMYHLINHGWFKALLFLCAGSVIHAMRDEQDMRKYGGLIRQLPYTGMLYIIGTLGLIGWPYMSGFYSKEKILEEAYIGGIEGNMIGRYVYYIGIITACITTIYSMRSLYLTFISRTNALKPVIREAGENGVEIKLTMGILGFITIVFGYITSEWFVNPSYWWNSSDINIGTKLFKNMEVSGSVEEQIPSGYLAYILLIPIMFILVSVYGIYEKSHEVVKFWKKRWGIDDVYSRLIAEPILINSHRVFYKEIDRGVIEQIGRLGLDDILSKVSIDNNIRGGSRFSTWINIIIGMIMVLLIIG